MHKCIQVYLCENLSIFQTNVLSRSYFNLNDDIVYSLEHPHFFSILMVHSYLENTNKPYDITVFVQGNIIPGYKKGAIVLNVIYAGGIHLIEGC